MTPADFQKEAIALLEKNAAARERIRIRRLIDAMPVQSWETRRFKSQLIAQLVPTVAEGSEATVPGGGTGSSSTAATGHRDAAQAEPVG